MADKLNPFLAEGSEYIHPNAIFNPLQYERVGLYVLLYNEIYGSLADYGIKNRIALDVTINEKIKSIMKTVQKLQNNQGLTDTDPGYKPLSAEDMENMPHAEDWMRRILPDKAKETKEVKGITVTDEKAVEFNNNYVSSFIKNYEPTVREAQRVAKLANKEPMLSVSDARLLLEAKRSKVREFYELVRKNQDYKPGKIDKDGNSKSGIHASAYFQALNELDKKNRKLHKNMFYNVVKGVGAAAFAGLTIASAGALLSYGGFALTAVFGNMFNAAGVGGAVLGGLGTLFGFYGSKNLFKRFRDGLALSRKMRLERKEFKGPAYKGKDLEVFLANNFNKDGKNLTLNEKKTLFMFDKAAKAYFEKGVVPEDLKMYLPDSIIKKWKMDTDLQYFTFVSDKEGGFNRLLNKFANVVQNVPGTGKYSHTEALGHIQEMLKSNDLDNLEQASQFIDSYTDVITPAKAAELQRQVSHQVVNAFQNNVFEKPYNALTEAVVKNAMTNSTISKRLEDSGVANAKQRVEDIGKFLKVESEGSDVPLNADLGVTMGAMFDMTPASMKRACSTLANGVPITAELSTKIDNAVSAIGSLATRQDAGSVTDLIDEVRTASPKMGDYLDFMLKKKVAQSKNGQDAISNTIMASGIAAGTPIPAATPGVITISEAIASLKRNDKGEIVATSGGGVSSIEDIRDFIYNPTHALTTEQQKTASKQLDEQIKAIERGERDSARASAYETIKNGGYVGLNEVMDSIGKITLDTISSVETKDLYDKKIVKGVMKDYLTSQFKSKIEKLFTIELEDTTKYSGTGETVFKNITEKLQQIDSCRYLEPAQKARLNAKLSQNLGKSFDTIIQNMEIDFVEQVSKGGLGDRIKNYLTGNYSDSGLRDYFKLNTPESESIKNRIIRLQTGANIVSLLNAQVDVSPTIKEESHPDTKLCTFAYFQCDNSEKVRTKLDEMKTYSTIATTDQFGAIGPIDDPAETKNFIHNMKKLVNGIDVAGSSLAGDDLAQLSVLLVAKKRCLAAYKLNMQRYLIEKAGNAYNSLEKFIHDNPAERDAFVNNVVKKWQDLILKDIDDKIQDLLTKDRVKEIISAMGIYNYNDACSIVASSMTNMDTYMKSAQMGN